MHKKYYLLLLLAHLISLSLNSSVIAESIPNLSGNWVLDQDESDDPKALLAKSMEVFDPSAIKVVETARGPVAMGRYIRRPSHEKLDAAFSFLNSVVPLNAIVQIEHNDPLLVLKYDDGSVRTIYTDERDSAATVQSTAIDHDQRLMFAAWEQNNVVIESNTTSGTLVLENLSLVTEDGEPDVLHVLIEMRTSRLRPLLFKYQYQPSIQKSAQ